MGSGGFDAFGSIWSGGSGSWSNRNRTTTFRTQLYIRRDFYNGLKPTLEITIEKNAVFLKKLHFGLKFRPKMAHIQQIGLGGPNILKVRTFLAIYE